MFEKWLQEKWKIIKSTFDWVDFESPAAEEDCVCWEFDELNKSWDEDVAVDDNELMADEEVDEEVDGEGKMSLKSLRSFLTEMEELLFGMSSSHFSKRLEFRGRLMSIVYFFVEH